MEALIIVANRLNAPRQLLHLATYEAETDETARIVANPYAVAVKIVLSDLDYAVSKLRSELKAGRPGRRAGRSPTRSLMPRYDSAGRFSVPTTPRYWPRQSEWLCTSEPPTVVRPGREPHCDAKARPLQRAIAALRSHCRRIRAVM